METRRTRRMHQRNMRRIALFASSIGIVGLAVGLSLPHSATASLRASRHATFERWRARLAPIGEVLFPSAPPAPNAPDPADFWSSRPDNR